MSSIAVKTTPIATSFIAPMGFAGCAKIRSVQWPTGIAASYSGTIVAGGCS